MPTRPPVHRAPGHRTEQQRKREVDQRRRNDPARALYRTARWQRLRAQKLATDSLCQCDECKVLKRITPATVVDHIKDHKGDVLLFFDWANLRSMAKPCHDRKTAATAGFNRGKANVAVRGCDKDGVPLDPDHPWRAP